MTTEGPKKHDLDPLPDELVGRAVKDKEFRDGVLERRNDAKALDVYLRGKGFKNVSPEAIAFIQGLNDEAVNNVLHGVDAGAPVEEIAGA